ncbi:homoserine kinase [Chondromyces apiculatus]|uniref:Homoserine kinase n=1 Tax=Chondromyces apiculatus DSM 436 TaxID=1192034 RepID=A0A017SYG6_9BACT|nr:homoserine kinase [Chondromyces apiculatus]EYF01346.1 Homoserine kinase [Chondromyces apiculatus DSM 436]
MALLTPLSGDEARALGERYGLAVVGVEGLVAGSVNSNFRLSLEGDGAAFLRVYEEQGTEGAAQEARLVEALAEGGVATPRPMRVLGAPATTLSLHAGKPVAVLPWVAGEMVCQRGVTPEHARKVGAALAQVHAVGARVEGAAESRFNLEALGERLAGVRAQWEAGKGETGEARKKGDGVEVRSDVRADVEALGEQVARLREEAQALGAGPSVVIHGDLFRDNVLWRGGEIAALLDFESASRGSAAFDLAVTALAWCFGDALDARLVQAMGAGYASVRRLGREEEGRLFHEARVAAVRFAVTRITDYELRPEGRQYRDYRRFLARLGAVEGLGPEGFARLLSPAAGG